MLAGGCLAFGEENLPLIKYLNGVLVAVGWWSVSVDIVIYLSSVHDWILLDYGKRVIPLQDCRPTNASTNDIGIILRWWIVIGNKLIQFMKLQVHWLSSVLFFLQFDFSSSCFIGFLRPLSWGQGNKPYIINFIYYLIIWSTNEASTFALKV